MLDSADRPQRARSILRSAMTRIINAREAEARTYLMRRLPGLDRDPFALGRERRESFFEVVSPSRA